jgi:hypothetical protein
MRFISAFILIGLASAAPHLAKKQNACSTINMPTFTATQTTQAGGYPTAISSSIPKNPTTPPSSGPWIETPTTGQWSGKTVYHDTWVLDWTNYEIKADAGPDMYPPQASELCKRVITVNGKWPPPPVVVDKGNIIMITVKNQGIDDQGGISLHAHGLYQKNRFWMDGPASLLQQ